MPLKKVSKDSNMYQGWVSHTHSHLAGACPHQCSYCYVSAMSKRFPNMAARYSGVLWLDNAELAVNYGTGRTIFVEHLNDLFAAKVPDVIIRSVLRHCWDYPRNTYVFQTKNPARYAQFLNRIPAGSVLGTTIETNRHYPQVMRDAPAPVLRLEGMMELPAEFTTFVTIEPILDFDLEDLADWLIELAPDFVNVGADSKGTGLPEPSGQKVRALIAALQEAGLEIRQKTNLERLLT
jgi:protein gp37